MDRAMRKDLDFKDDEVSEIFTKYAIIDSE